jgi:hypothetical protein
MTDKLKIGDVVEYTMAMGGKRRGVVVKIDAAGTVYVKLPVHPRSSKKNTGIVFFEASERCRLSKE